MGADAVRRMTGSEPDNVAPSPPPRAGAPSAMATGTGRQRGGAVREARMRRTLALWGRAPRSEIGERLRLAIRSDYSNRRSRYVVRDDLARRESLGREPQHVDLATRQPAGFLGRGDRAQPGGHGPGRSLP